MDTQFSFLLWFLVSQLKVWFSSLFILLYIHLFIICLFSNPKTFQVSRCACKLPQTRLCMTLTEIVYDQFQGPTDLFLIRCCCGSTAKYAIVISQSTRCEISSSRPMSLLPNLKRPWNNRASFGECLLVTSNPWCGYCSIKNSVSVGPLLRVWGEWCFSRCGPRATRIRVSGGGAQESAFPHVP